MVLTIEKKKFSIYLAGKIEPNGWRESVMPMRESFSAGDNEAPKLLKTASIDIGWANITGPFFLGCDHSCYHGSNSHGLGASKGGCYGQFFSEQEVIDICMEQIRRADAVIAYIDDDTCYGTIYELGVAKEMGKLTATIFDTKNREKEMWFIAKNSDFSMNIEGFQSAGRDAISQSIMSTVEKLKAIQYKK